MLPNKQELADLVKLAYDWSLSPDQTGFSIRLESGDSHFVPLQAFRAELCNAIMNIISSFPLHSRAVKVRYTIDLHESDYPLLTDEFAPIYLRKLVEISAYDEQSGVVCIVCEAYAASSPTQPAQQVLALYHNYLTVQSVEWMEHYYPGSIQRIALTEALGYTAAERAEAVCKPSMISASMALPEELV